MNSRTRLVTFTMKHTGIGFAVLAALAMLLLTVSIFSAANPSTAHAQENNRTEPPVPAGSDADDNRADIIVQFDDSASVVRRIQFSEPISGFEALLRSGLDIAYQEFSFGPAICSIEGVGCPLEDCFCGGDSFWNYNYWDGKEWQSYDVGAGGSTLTETGAIEGFRWGEFGAPMTPATQTVAAQRAIQAVSATQVMTDGGFGSLRGSVEALIALGANRQASNEQRTDPTASSLLGYLMLNGATYTTPGFVTPAAVGKLAAGAASTDTCWPLGAATSSSVYSPTFGAYSVHAGINAWGVIGALSFDGSAPPSAVEALRTSIRADGGWEWMSGPNFKSDTNTTSLVIQALIGAGEPISSTEIISGMLFLAGAENEDGGFTYDPNSESSTESDANSTSYAIQALYALGEDPADPRWTTGDGHTPVSYLLDLQLADGSLEWMAGIGTNALATQQAIPALLGRSFPFDSGIDGCYGIHLPTIAR